MMYIYKNDERKTHMCWYSEEDYAQANPSLFLTQSQRKNSTLGNGNSIYMAAINILSKATKLDQRTYIDGWKQLLKVKQFYKQLWCRGPMHSRCVFMEEL